LFYYEVDKKVFNDYLTFVPFEMNMEKIKKRLENGFYRHKEAIINDINLIETNCARYNQSGTEIIDWAKELCNSLRQAVKGSLDLESFKK